ncbi:hypothetical protein GTA08_BOTSDO02006 [Neofusicoccum parvum]|nr:hypothetical protein GTA08_BOTSDO02006 [Neofusicoccum parvum]
MSTTTSTMARGRQLSTDLINSRRAPKPETTAQPTTKEIKLTSSAGLMGSKWAPKSAQPEPQAQAQPEPEIPTTSEQTPDEPEAKPEPEITTTTTEPDKKPEPETTLQPTKKSWADLYEEDIENESNTTTTTTTSEPESDDASTTTKTISPPNDNKSTSPSKEPTEEQPKSNKPPAGMLNSRWADANYECKPAQTRAESRTAHANDRPANKKQSSKWRRRK